MHFQKIELEKAMTLPLGNDETLRTRTLATLPLGIVGVNGVQCVYVVLGRALLLLSKDFFEVSRLPHRSGSWPLFFEKLGARAVVTSKQSPHLLLPLTIFWSARTQDSS